MHGESNFLSLLIENNKNIFDIDQIEIHINNIQNLDNSQEAS